MAKSYEVIERVGFSTESISNAVKEALTEAGYSKKSEWFEIVETRGRITSEGKVEFQVKVKIARKL